MVLRQTELTKQGVNTMEVVTVRCVRPIKIKRTRFMLYFPLANADNIVWTATHSCALTQNINLRAKSYTVKHPSVACYKKNREHTIISLIDQMSGRS